MWRADLLSWGVGLGLGLVGLGCEGLVVGLGVAGWWWWWWWFNGGRTGTGGTGETDGL
jgi:hypothetical protein